MRIRTVIAFATALLAASPVYAQDSTAPAVDFPAAPATCSKDGTPIPDSTLQIARGILAATKATDHMMLAVDTMMPAMINMIRKTNPGLSKDAVDAFSVALREEMVKSLPELVSVEACIYTQHFTADELRQLADIYDSPLGQKMLSENPTIFKESFAMGQAWGAKASREAVARVLSRQKKDGAKI
jgi:hypothetical protein